MTERRDYDEQTRAAVMAALLAGQSVNSVAKEYKIPKGTVSGWKDKALGVVTEATQKRDEIGGKLYAYLLASLDALKAQSIVFADPAWLRKQPANELAVLHGVLTDKAIRLLEAQSADPENQSDDSG